MKSVVISEFMDEASVERMKHVLEVKYDPNLVDDRAALLASISHAEGLVVRNRTQVDEELLEAAPQLKLVGRLGVGLDNIDQAACKTRGIEVIPATGANTIAVAEYVIATALTLVRGAYGSSDAVASGIWPRQALIGGELSGKVLGLVGYGAIARASAERARAFGMSIVAYDPFLDANDPAWSVARRLHLEELLSCSDVISLHVPLSKDTQHLIDADALRHMKSTAIVINTSRGGVVDESALVHALQQGKLGGAALDVFEHEPVNEESGMKFKGVGRLIVTPHVAGVTSEANVRVSSMIADAVLDRLGACNE